MIESREELRSRLVEEYKSHKADESYGDSLLYRYFKEREERRAEGKLQSKESAREFLADKEEEKEYYLRLRVAYLAMGDEYQYITRDEYQEVRDALVDQLLGQKKMSAKTRESLPGASQEELEDRLLKKQAADFVYNEKRERSSKKESDDVRLLRFFERNTGQGCPPARDAGMPEVQAGRKLDEAFIKKCERVCRLLRDDMQKKEQTRVILPLYVEESTGAGIYLMGRDNIPETEIPETKLPKAYRSFPCYPCVVCYEECARERKIKWGSTRINGIPMDDRRMIFYLSVKVFFRVEDAVEYLKSRKENGGLKNGYRLDNAAMEYNVPPEQLDPEFSSFFYENKRPRILSKEDLSEEERTIIEREDREEKAARRREEDREKRLSGAEKKKRASGKIRRTV